jgi:hypothetical protein
MAMPTVVVRGILAAASTSLLIALAGCGSNPQPAPENPAPSPQPVGVPVTTMAVPDREPHTLVLNATGTAKVTSIKYTLDGRVVQQGSVTLPWRESISVPADGLAHSWTLDVEFTGNGSVELSAIFNGQMVAQGGSAGSGNTKGGAGVGGTVNS